MNPHLWQCYNGRKDEIRNDNRSDNGFYLPYEVECFFLIKKIARDKEESC